MSCPHTVKRCETCGLHDGSSCSIEVAVHQDRKAQGRNYSGAFIAKPVVLDDEALALIDECSDGVEY